MIEGNILRKTMQNTPKKRIPSRFPSVDSKYKNLNLDLSNKSFEKPTEENGSNQNTTALPLFTEPSTFEPKPPHKNKGKPKGHVRLRLDLEEFSFKRLERSIKLKCSPKKQTTPSLPDHILENRVKMIVAIQLKQPYLVLESLFENLASAIQNENLDFLFSTIFLIGEFYLMAHDLKNAVYCFNHLTSLADMTGNRQSKVDLYLNLADCCKRLRKYDFSLRFLKKALQYAWFFKDQSKELLIYDHMGLVHYLLGDLYRAKYYHERFVNSHPESFSSPCRRSSQEVLTKFFSLNSFETNTLNGPPGSTSQLTLLILTRLGLNKEWDDKTNSPIFKKKPKEPEPNQVGFFYARKNSNSVPKLRFMTTLEVEGQLHAIFQSREFQFDISSPRYLSVKPKISLKSLKNINKSPQKSEERVMHALFNKTLDKLEFNKTKPKVCIIEDPMKKKIPLEEKIRFRMSQDWKDFDLEQKIKGFISLRKQQAEDKGHPCLYNHLTPNRSLLGYEYHLSERNNSYLEKINSYYRRICQFQPGKQEN